MSQIILYFQLNFLISFLVDYINSHCSSMCCLLSIIPHQWQYISSWRIKFLVYNVSLLPSHPILILKIYLISLTQCLFSLMYSCVLTWYLFCPSSQKSLSIGNSFCIYVLCLALRRISLLMMLLTIYCHFT